MAGRGAQHRQAGKVPLAAILPEPPFFIVGSGRSGTTLLQSILLAHPRLAVTPETHFCKNATQLAGVPLDEAPPDFDAYWQAYCATPRFASLQVDAGRCRELIEVQGVKSFATVLTALLAAYLEKAGKRRVGEKTPGHLHHAEWLLRVFPDARIVAMQRDPRAMIASLLGTPWRRMEPDLDRSTVARCTRLHAVARDARRWADVNGRILPRLARDPRVMRLRYEDLVHDPRGAVERVCGFLGERFEPEMLARRGAAAAFDPVAAGWKGDWARWTVRHHASARAPISTASLEKWRGQLSWREVAVIESLTGDAMTTLGYDTETTPAERRRATRAAGAADVVDRIERRMRRAVVDRVRRRSTAP